MREKTYQPFVGKYIIAIFAVLGIIGILAGGFLAADTALFIKNSVRTTGTITKVSISYAAKYTYVCDATVSYTVDGKDYEHLLKRYDKGSNLKRDDYIGIQTGLLYNADDPSDARSPNKPFALPMLTLLAGTASAGLCGYLIRHNKYYEKLIKNGVALAATVTEIKTEAITTRHSGRNIPESFDTVTVNNTIICEWTNALTGETYTFTSRKVKEYVDPYVGHEITVYADPNDYGKYFVDVDSLLEKPLPIKRNTPPPEIKRAPWEEP